MKFFSLILHGLSYDASHVHLSSLNFLHIFLQIFFFAAIASRRIFVYIWEDMVYHAMPSGWRLQVLTGCMYYSAITAHLMFWQSQNIWWEVPGHTWGEILVVMIPLRTIFTTRWHICSVHWPTRWDVFAFSKCRPIMSFQVNREWR